MNIFAFLLFAIFLTFPVARSAFIDGLRQDLKLTRRGSGRITNGTLVHDLSGFGYQVGILSFKEAGNTFWCGGCLISNQWVLTAAHCLNGTVKSNVYLGVIDKESAIKISPQFQVKSSDYVIHKFYRFPVNDIALFKLPRPVELTSTIQTIAVSKDPELTKWDNKDAIVSGWGMTRTAGPTSKFLQYVEVKIISNEECKNSWPRILPTQICQKVIDNKGTCQGDSGGPLVVIENGKRILIGVVSFVHISGCEVDIPRVYTRVGSYHQWICENTERMVC